MAAAGDECSPQGVADFTQNLASYWQVVVALLFFVVVFKN